MIALATTLSLGADAGGDPLRLLLTAALMVVLLCCSAAFSGSEPALFALSPLQLQQFSTSGNALKRWAAVLMHKPRRTLMVILVGNTAVNVGLFAVSVELFNELVPWLGAWVPAAGGAAIVLLTILLGETIPKVLAVAQAERAAPLAAAFIGMVGYVLGPISALLNVTLVEPFLRLLGGGPGPSESGARELSNDELKTLLEMSRHEGLINPMENSFLREVVDLSYLRVRDVMVPRVEVQAYDVNDPPEGLMALMRATRRKKIPVFDRSVDNIIGLVYAKVLFFNPGRPLRELVQSVRFVPEIATCEQLLVHFRHTRTQLAIAVDEFGGMAGLVTLEDLLETIVGEIHAPEEQAREPEIAQISDTDFEVDGRLNVGFWAETFALPRLTEKVATVAGLVTARLGRPARVGDVVRLGNVELRVARVKGRRIERVEVRRLARQEAYEEAVR